MHWGRAITVALVAMSGLIGSLSLSAVRAQDATPAADCPATTAEENKALVEGWLEFGVQAPEYAQVWKDQPPSSPYWDYYDADALAERINAPGLHAN